MEKRAYEKDSHFSAPESRTHYREEQDRSGAGRAVSGGARRFRDAGVLRLHLRTRPFRRGHRHHRRHRCGTGAPHGRQNAEPGQSCLRFRSFGHGGGNPSVRSRRQHRDGALAVHAVAAGKGGQRDEHRRGGGSDPPVCLRGKPGSEGRLRHGAYPRRARQCPVHVLQREVQSPHGPLRRFLRRQMPFPDRTVPGRPGGDRRQARHRVPRQRRGDPAGDDDVRGNARVCEGTGAVHRHAPCVPRAARGEQPASGDQRACLYAPWRQHSVRGRIQKGTEHSRLRGRQYGS